MHKQVALKIYGKVQGVSFREMSRRKAKDLGLSGWVRNEPDGTVKIVAEGEEKKLKEMIEWCRNGFEYAKVEKMDVEWANQQFNSANKFDDFLIK